MLRNFIEWWRLRQMQKLALSWKEVNGRIALRFQELVYAVWEKGYIAGKVGIDPEESWKGVADSQGIKRGVSQQIKEVTNNGTGKN